MNPTAEISRPITKNGVRILRPSEWNRLSQSIPDVHKVNADTLLLSGLRYMEARRLQTNPGWFDGRFLQLPKEAVGKELRHQKERWVRLSDRGRETIGKFFSQERLPVWQVWGRWMKSWGTEAGLDPLGLCAKTTRKTWESWLAFAFMDKPSAWVIITTSQGHTSGTSVSHYLNTPFIEDDLSAMQPWISGFL